MPKLLVNVDNVQVGDHDPDGVTFIIRLLPIVSDSTLRNAMETQDYFVLETDDGQSPLGYYNLLISETQAFMLTVHGITLAQDDITILGWNDFRFYGTTSYEIIEDFFAARATSTGNIGHYGWEFFESWGWGPAVGSTSSTEHPGKVPIRSSPSVANTNMRIYHTSFYHISRLEEIVVIVSPTASTNATYLAGMSNSAASLAPSTGLQMVYSGAGGFWFANKRDISGLVSTASTITIVTGHWYRFRAVLVSHNPAASSMVWNLTIEDLTAATSWTQSSVTFVYSGTTFLQPGFNTQNSTTAQCGLDIDLWSAKVRDLTRTLTEF